MRLAALLLVLIVWLRSALFDLLIGKNILFKLLSLLEFLLDCLFWHDFNILMKINFASAIRISYEFLEFLGVSVQRQLKIACFLRVVFTLKGFKKSIGSCFRYIFSLSISRICTTDHFL